MKRIRSIRFELKGIVVYVISLVLLYLIIFAWTIFEIYVFNNNYLQMRKDFNQINDVIANRSEPKVLLDVMEKYGYDTKEYTGSLENYQRGLLDREKLVSQIRVFAEFLRSYEARFIKSQISQIRWTYAFLVIASLFLIVKLFKSGRLFLYSIDKILKKVSYMSENMYISKIPLEEPRFEEDVQLNRSISNINDILSIYETFKHMPMNYSVEDFIYGVGPYLCNIFNSQRFSVAFIDWESQDVIAEVAYISKPGVVPKLTEGFSQKLNETSLGEMVAKNETTRIINNFKERQEKTGSLSLKLLLEEGFNSNITQMLSINSRPFGFLFLASDKNYNYTEKDAKLFASISTVISYRLFYSLTIQRAFAYFGNSLVNLVEFKDSETGNHIKRVANYSKIIAQQLNLHPKKVREIFEFSPLHDIGKIGIPDSILLKPSRLDSREWEVMKKHVTYGLMIIENFEKQVRSIIQESSLLTIKNIIADHHERFDGKGYPVGKKGDQISIEGRIVALADVFDALTTKRPYKEVMSFEEALEVIVSENGTHFDPKIVEAFLTKIEDVRKVYEELKD